MAPSLADDVSAPLQAESWAGVPEVAAVVVNLPPPCRIYVSDPEFFRPDVRVKGWQSCRLEDIGTHFYQLCIQYKKRRFFGLFRDWVDLKCSPQDMSGIAVVEPRAKLMKTVTAHCKEGRHTYRGVSRGSYVDRGGGLHSAAVQSLHYLTAEC